MKTLSFGKYLRKFYNNSDKQSISFTPQTRINRSQLLIADGEILLP